MVSRGFKLSILLISVLALGGLGHRMYNLNSKTAINTSAQADANAKSLKNYSETLKAIAEQINSSNEDLGWTAVNPERFLHMEFEEVKALMGAKFGEKRLKTREEKDFITAAPPTSFDARVAWPNCTSIQTIFDQANCGSWWAFGAIETLQDRYWIKSGQKTQILLSPEDLNDCWSSCGSGWGGGYPDAAWEYFDDIGVCTGGKYLNEDFCKPYSLSPCSHHTESTKYPPCKPPVITPQCYYYCPNRYYPTSYGKDHHFGGNAERIPAQQMTAEISTNGPIQVSFQVYEDFLTYQQGVYQHKTGKLLGSHSVKIIGYGTENGKDFWLVANSWNETWGDKGFFKILRGTNECQIESDAMAGQPSNMSRKEREQLKKNQKE